MLLITAMFIAYGTVCLLYSALELLDLCLGLRCPGDLLLFADNNSQVNVNNNADNNFSRDFRLIVGAAALAATRCPGGFIRKGAAGAVTFSALSGMYTINTAIRNPEGIQQVREIAHTIINGGQGNGSSSSMMMGMTHNLSSAVNGSLGNSIENYNTLFMQYNAIIPALYTLTLAIGFLTLLFVVQFVINKYRVKILAKFNNRVVKAYLMYQYFLNTVFLTVGPLFTLACYVYLVYGLHFLVNNPLPELT
jgi:hypothetical protein